MTARTSPHPLVATEAYTDLQRRARGYVRPTIKIVKACDPLGDLGAVMLDCLQHYLDLMVEHRGDHVRYRVAGETDETVLKEMRAWLDQSARRWKKSAVSRLLPNPFGDVRAALPSPGRIAEVRGERFPLPLWDHGMDHLDASAELARQRPFEGIRAQIAEHSARWLAAVAALAASTEAS